MTLDRRLDHPNRRLRMWPRSTRRGVALIHPGLRDFESICATQRGSCSPNAS